jgi:hypothetical protein
MDLDVDRISDCCGLSSGLVASFCEAAKVVMNRAHSATGSPTPAIISQDPSEVAAQIIWSSPSEDERASHDNRIDAIESAAYAVAILTVFHYLGLRVVRRAVERSGADFLMCRARSAVDGSTFVRLEVSGISTSASPAARLESKVNQLVTGDDPRPGHAVVVAFPNSPVRVLIGATR